MVQELLDHGLYCRCLRAHEVGGSYIFCAVPSPHEGRPHVDADGDTTGEWHLHELTSDGLYRRV